MRNKQEEVADELSENSEMVLDDHYVDTTNQRGCCRSVSFFTRLKFMGINTAALMVGFFLGGIIRFALGKASKQEPLLIHGKHEVNLGLTDVVSCLAILLVCQFLVRPEKTPYKKTCCKPLLFTRMLVRDSIPLLFGLGSMLLVKELMNVAGQSDYYWSGPHDSRVIEFSDGIGGFVSLMSFYLLDRLLNCCGWRANPYEPIPGIPQVTNVNSSINPLQMQEYQ